MAKILITGGAGFIGSHLAVGLANLDHDVTFLDNLDSYYEVGIKRKNLDIVLQSKSCRFVEGDILDAGIAFAKKVIAGEVEVNPIKIEPIDVPESLPEVDIGNLSRKTDEILKKAILEGAKLTLEEGLKVETSMFGECVRTKDMRIGMGNFMKFGPKKAARFAHF